MASCSKQNAQLLSFRSNANGGLVIGLACDGGAGFVRGCDQRSGVSRLLAAVFMTFWRRFASNPVSIWNRSRLQSVPSRFAD